MAIDEGTQSYPKLPLPRGFGCVEIYADSLVKRKSPFAERFKNWRLL